MTSQVYKNDVRPILLPHLKDVSGILVGLLMTAFGVDMILDMLLVEEEAADLACFPLRKGALDVRKVKSCLAIGRGGHRREESLLGRRGGWEIEG